MKNLWKKKKGLAMSLGLGDEAGVSALYRGLEGSSSACARMSGMGDRPQDPSSALEQATQDVANLKSEFSHIMEEMRNADSNLVEMKRKYLGQDSQLQKFVRQQGSGVENAKEGELSRKISEEMARCEALQEQKCVLANTALYLVAKHLRKISSNIESLEEEGLLAPLEEELLEEEAAATAPTAVGAVASSSGSGSTSNRNGRKRPASGSQTGSQTGPGGAGGSGPGPGGPRKQREPKKERSRSHQRGGTASSRDATPHSQQSSGPLADPTLDGLGYNEELFKMNQGEEDDKQLYCFCQSVSYGEMVACDGPHCKYEWFHYSCVNLTEPPKGQWYCPDCRQEMAAQKVKKKRKQ